MANVRCGPTSVAAFSVCLPPVLLHADMANAVATAAANAAARLVNRFIWYRLLDCDRFFPGPCGSPRERRFFGCSCSRYRLQRAVAGFAVPVSRGARCTEIGMLANVMAGWSCATPTFDRGRRHRLLARLLGKCARTMWALPCAVPASEDGGCYPRRGVAVLEWHPP